MAASTRPWISPGSAAMPCAASRSIDLTASTLQHLRARIALDRSTGLTPFLVVGSAGTVDIGAIDDLRALSALCREEGLWFHVDGAFGALGILSPMLAPRLAGLESADSIAFDFHKWGQVPYDAGFLIVRDGDRHRELFHRACGVSAPGDRGLAAGSLWPCDLGLDMSRGFRALKTWFTLKTYGTEKLGAVITRTCALASYLEARILAEPRLELLAPVQLNIVCFRYRAADPNKVNGEIVIDIQESGYRCAVDHPAGRPARNTRRHRQPSHRHLRSRRARGRGHQVRHGSNRIHRGCPLPKPAG